jgi:hypothetical protein
MRRYSMLRALSRLNRGKIAAFANKKVKLSVRSGLLSHQGNPILYIIADE